MLRFVQVFAVVAAVAATCVDETCVDETSLLQVEQKVSEGNARPHHKTHKHPRTVPDHHSSLLGTGSEEIVEVLPYANKGMPYNRDVDRQPYPPNGPPRVPYREMGPAQYAPYPPAGPMGAPQYQQPQAPVDFVGGDSPQESWQQDSQGDWQEGGPQQGWQQEGGPQQGWQQDPQANWQQDDRRPINYQDQEQPVDMEGYGSQGQVEDEGQYGESQDSQYGESQDSQDPFWRPHRRRFGTGGSGSYPYGGPWGMGYEPAYTPGMNNNFPANTPYGMGYGYASPMGYGGMAPGMMNPCAKCMMIPRPKYKAWCYQNCQEKTAVVGAHARNIGVAVGIHNRNMYAAASAMGGGWGWA